MAEHKCEFLCKQCHQSASSLNILLPELQKAIGKYCQPPVTYEVLIMENKDWCIHIRKGDVLKYCLIIDEWILVKLTKYILTADSGFANLREDLRLFQEKDTDNFSLETKGESITTAFSIWRNSKHIVLAPAYMARHRAVFPRERYENLFKELLDTIWNNLLDRTYPQFIR